MSNDGFAQFAFGKEDASLANKEFRIWYDQITLTASEYETDGHVTKKIIHKQWRIHRLHRLVGWLSAQNVHSPKLFENLVALHDHEDELRATWQEARTDAEDELMVAGWVWLGQHKITHEKLPS